MLQGNPEPCEQFSESIVRVKTDKIIKKTRTWLFRNKTEAIEFYIFMYL